MVHYGPCKSTSLAGLARLILDSCNIVNTMSKKASSLPLLLGDSDSHETYGTAELAELSTNPAVVRAANPRLKPQTISGSIAQVDIFANCKDLPTSWISVLAGGR